MELRTNGLAIPAAQRAVDRPLASSVSPAAAPGSAPDTAAAQPVQQAQAPHDAKLDDAVKRINASLQAKSQEVEFSVDKDTNQTVVKVVDTRTKEVLRQMPTEETLEIAKALDRVQGLLIRQKA